ncbi:MAG: hypothetical protein ACRD36_13390, partial [Candidatus Acidiferrum sp.]
MIRTVIVLIIFILAGSAGELAMTHGMKKVGEPERLRPWHVLVFVSRAVRTGWFWVGVPLMAVNFYLLMVLLSWEPISLIIPASALSYVVGTLGAKYVLQEDVNA